MSIRTDICIIGAGPGGAMTALRLAQLGIPSLLVDKAVFPRDKICGDALSGKVVEVFRKLDPGLVDRLAAHPEQVGSWGVNFVAPNTRALRVPFKKEFSKEEQAPGFISKRVDFDNFLIEECRRHSLISIVEGVALNKFERKDKEWLIHGKVGKDTRGFENASAQSGTSGASKAAPKDLTIQARLIIAADGAHSRFAKEYGGIKMEPKHYCAGIRAYYKGITGMDEDNFIELHFLKDLLPGYFWIFPLPGGYANVGVGMRSDVVSKEKVNLKQRMAEVIEQYPQLQERFANAEMVDSMKGFGLPLGSKKRPISGDGFMLIGDAASLIDPFTGEGIGNALYSGYFAAAHAQQALETGDLSADAFKAYDKQVYDRLWDELKLSRRMQQLVKYPWLFNFVVNKARKNKVLSETISCMFEDIDLRDRLRKPSFYFKLLFANGS